MTVGIIPFTQEKSVTSQSQVRLSQAVSQYAVGFDEYIAKGMLAIDMLAIAMESAKEESTSPNLKPLYI
ncbi:hypothetical protein [Moorena sp. SIO3H5]|uniref:hypothetical protein n=1 Tax=Moorena sp. SIO3H5 TaxID=2607834 RepID=UPI0013BA464B|nr:hypothetical protein [Moorena sp. SIO3H5]NEO71092.1 hypothetical protein [Moorena sp. SIO3H5]